MTVWRYIKEHDNGITNFHFEVAADLLNEEEMELIKPCDQADPAGNRCAVYQPGYDT